MNMESIKYTLSEDKIPKHWYNIQAYIDYHAGKLKAYEYPQEEVAMALAGLPQVG